MRKFKAGDMVTPKASTDPKRRLVYYAEYYARGLYGEKFLGKVIEMAVGAIGRVKSIAPSVTTSAKHKEFLVIDFYHPLTERVERCALHHNEVDAAEIVFGPR